MTHRLVETADGSQTVEWVERRLLYRSPRGAHAEARGVFVDNTELADVGPHWQVAELGFGVGTTFRVALEAARARGAHLTWWSCERAPAPPGIVPDEPTAGRALVVEALEQMHNGARGWVELQEPDVRLHVWHGEFLDAPYPETTAHAFCLDPFGPSDEPDSWSAVVCEKVARVVAPGGYAATYSSAGHVRRALTAAGLEVEKLPGPGTKREVVRARRPR